MEDQVLIYQLQSELPILESEVFSIADLLEKWSHYFNNLILNDFGALISLLYRIDISEARLRQLLKENSSVNAGELIAGLVMERLMQKIRTRETYRSKPNSPAGSPDAEEW